MTKKELTKTLKEMCGNNTLDPITDISQLNKFLLIVKILSPNCYKAIYQAEILSYKIQSEFCEEWGNLLEWDKVEHTGSFNHYYIGDLRISEETQD